jgi:membrane dipeptidase
MTLLPVFDSHADSLQRQLDLGHDLGVRGPGHLDVVRGREGGLEALVFVCWVDPSYLDEGPGGAFRRTEGLLGEFHRLCERHPERVRWAGNGELYRAATGAGALAGIPGIEGGHSIEEDLGLLEHFFERGVRVMTLVWNNHLSWVRSCLDGAGAGVPEGLSGFGREVVRRMNELGMVVDLSHAGRRSFYDALEASEQPVIASHSGCSALHDHPRNLDDEQLRALAAAGGVVGVVFCTAFLDADAQAEDARLRESEAYRGLSASDDSELFCAQSELLQREARPLAAERVVDHIQHAVEVAGIDHVGLGSDFDGIQRTPAGLEDASRYPLLAELLVKRGFDREDARKVLGGNMKRVFEQVTGPGTRAAVAGLTSINSKEKDG